MIVSIPYKLLRLYNLNYIGNNRLNMEIWKDEYYLTICSYTWINVTSFFSMLHHSFIYKTTVSKKEMATI
jgi:hypothetical protein